jgi:hypothetical protein
MESTESVLPYATPAAPTRASRYAVASLFVSAASTLWLALMISGAPLPFDVYKGHRIGTVGSVLGLIFAVAAYWQPNRGRTMAHVAVAVAGAAFVAYFLVGPV